MSFKLMAWAWDQKTKSATNKIVLLSLADRANDEGQCWPGVEKIAEDTQLSSRSVRRALSDLEEAKYLRRNYREQNSTIYQLPTPETTHRERLSLPPDTGSSIPLTQGHPPPDTGAPTPPDTESPKPISKIEPIIEPRKDVQSQAFALFWKAYPIKRNKKKAEAIWKRRKLDRIGETLLEDVLMRKQSDENWRKGFVPHATTYLNGDRWEDELKTKSMGKRANETTTDYWRRQERDQARGLAQAQADSDMPGNRRLSLGALLRGEGD